MNRIQQRLWKISFLGDPTSNPAVQDNDPSDRKHMNPPVFTRSLGLLPWSPGAVSPPPCGLPATRTCAARCARSWSRRSAGRGRRRSCSSSCWPSATPCRKSAARVSEAPCQWGCFCDSPCCARFPTVFDSRLSCFAFKRASSETSPSAKNIFSCLFNFCPPGISVG